MDGTGGRVHELTVSSPGLGRNGSVSVLLPVGYHDAANADRTSPILWLLHGIGDDHRSWRAKSDVEALTAGLPLVVAMPEAGRNAETGWYSDWVAGPAWETFHLEELLPLVEERFDAGQDRRRRVLAGQSMGGFGAMAYAARHPDLWSAAASFSGAVHTTMFDAAGALAFDTFRPYRGCGTHQWHHWQADLTATLPELMAVLAAPPEPPLRFDHRFVEDRREVFGWTFEVTGRAAPAFTDLTDISAAGLTAAGAGILSATTPPDHPGRWRVTSPLGATEVDADPDGRLRFELPLSADPLTVRLEAVAAAGFPAPAPTATPAAAGTRAGNDRVAALPATGSGAALAPAALLLALAVIGWAHRRHRT